MFNWGYVGCGDICKVTAEEILKLENHKIKSVYSRTFSRCKEFANKYGATAYETFDELLNSGIDALYIGTPHSSHFVYAKKALEHKIPVLCEKPITLNFKQADELIKTAKQNDTYFVEAMWTWFNLTASEVRSWIKEGLIGNVKQMDATFRVPLIYPITKDRVANPACGGGSLLDLGVYTITYAYALFGYPSKIEVKGKLDKGIDIFEEVILSYDNGFTAKLVSGFDKLTKCALHIYGDEGKITLPISFHSSRRANLNGKVKKTFKDKEDIGLYAREFDLVSKEIKNNLKESKFVPFKQTLDVMRIMDEVRKQLNLVYPNE